MSGQQQFAEESQHTNKDIVDELVKTVGQCLLESVSKRGCVRDSDISEIFSKREREYREEVLKKVKKELYNVFGYKLDYDEETKRYYLSTKLRKGIELAEKMANEANEDIEMDDDIVQEDDPCNNEQFKDGLLNLTLMFIFMSKRQSGNSVEAEKGVDQKLMNAFLDEMYDSFGIKHLSAKQYGELFGPAKSAEFISKGWLRCDIRRDPTTGIEEIAYHWGSQAETVISKKQMLQTFCDVYGTPVNAWPNHAKIAGFRGTAYNSQSQG